jgi:hypothetical protein
MARSAWRVFRLIGQERLGSGRCSYVRADILVIFTNLRGFHKCQFKFRPGRLWLVASPRSFAPPPPGVVYRHKGFVLIGCAGQLLPVRASAIVYNAFEI